MSENVDDDLEDLYEHAPCGYVSLTPDGRIVKLNATLVGWLGRDKRDLSGHKFADVMGFGARIAFETHLIPTLRLHGQVGEIAFELLDSASNKIPVIANASEKRAKDGSHLFTRITLFKAVDRRRYERELLDARDKAQSAVLVENEVAQLREQFIAVLGHDLRNPLAAIAAGTKLLEREMVASRRQMVSAEVSRSINRANTLIDNVLDFARGRLGEGLVLDQNDDGPLTPVLEQVVREIQLVAPDRMIQTDFALEEPVVCDRQRVGQLLSNLLSNAVAHGEPAGRILVAARSTDGTFRLAVTNQGDPIPERAREKLFEPFFRGEVRRSQQGLGLGLFIVSEIAKAHGGAMEVASSKNETSFVFTMPQRRSG